MDEWTAKGYSEGVVLSFPGQTVIELRVRFPLPNALTQQLSFAGRLRPPTTVVEAEAAARSA